MSTKFDFEALRRPKKLHKVAGATSGLQQKGLEKDEGNTVVDEDIASFCIGEQIRKPNMFSMESISKTDLFPTGKKCEMHKQMTCYAKILKKYLERKG